MSSFPYVPTSNIFNTADYTILTDELTREVADKLYLSISDGRYITGITAGTAQASKALVLDSSLNISGINDVSSSYLETKNTNSTLITSSSIGSNYGLHLHSVLASSNGTYAGSSISFNNSSIDNVPLGAICLNKVSGGVGDLLFSTRGGSTCDERMRILSSGNVAIGTTTASYKLNVSGDINCSGSFRVNGTALVGFTGTSNSYTINANGDCPAFVIDSNDGVGGTESGMRIYANATSSFTYSSINFFDPNRLVNIMSISTWQQNCVHMRPQSGSDVSANMSNVALCCGLDGLFRKTLMITPNSLTSSANYTPAATASIVADNTYPDGPYNKALRIANTNGTTEMQIQVWDASLGDVFIGNISNSNLRFGTNNSTQMILTTAGRLGVGMTNPRCGLEVSGTVSQTTVPVLTNTYIYNVSTGVWTNLGGGPVTYSVCAWFNDDIYVNNSVYTTSDRRLKENIKSLDVDIERYKLLKPVSYNYINQIDKTKLGFIAQDVMKVCGEAITFNDNENLKVEQEGDIEGIQMGMDYNSITVMNTVIIKKLIDKIETLEKELELIKNYNPLKKYLDKV
jgi:hypothetical protein